MENKLVKVFTGSDIEANYVASLLKENNIDYTIENTFNQSISAGWVSGSCYNSSIIRINVTDIEKASSLINEYLKSTENNL